jgi:hypothetical protein
VAGTRRGRDDLRRGPGALELEALSRRPGEISLEIFQSLPASASMVVGWAFPSTSSGMEFPPTAAYHFGAAAVLAVILGFSSLSRRSLFFGALLVVGFALSLGAATPVSGWAHQLPGLSAFRHPFKHLFEVSLAMSVLAALGAQRLIQWRRGARWPRVVVAAAVVACCLSLRVNQGSLVAGNPASVEIAGQRPGIIDQMEAGWRVLTPRQYFQKRDPDFLLGDYPSQFAVPALHGAGPYLWKELADATGMVEEETTFRHGLFDAADRTLALLSCRYLIQTRHDDKFYPSLDASAYRVVARSDETRLMERQDALARIRFVGDVRCSDSQTIATALHGGSVDPGEIALMDCSKGPRPPTALTDVTSLKAAIVADRPGYLEIATKVPSDGHAFLVVSQADYPGWEARTDGAPVEIRRVHGLVQGIEVPGGTSRVELSYWPRSFRIGATTSAISILVLLAMALASARCTRRRTAVGAAARDRVASE